MHADLVAPERRLIPDHTTSAPRSVTVSQPNGMADVTATVTYDAAATSPAALIKAVTDRGYPAGIATPGKS